MAQRQPDSRVPFGQAIEDRLDRASESMRRDTRIWIERQMRGTPNDREMLNAIVTGVAGGVLDQLHEMAAGDPERMAASWAGFLAMYLDQQAEDAAADAEPKTETPDA